jgi:hypothetical protein
MVAAKWVQKVFPEKIRSAFREKAGGVSPSSHSRNKDSVAGSQPKNRSKK